MMDEFQCFSKGLTYISLLSDERVITVGASGMPLIVSSSGKITLDDADDDLSLGLVSDESNGVFYASFDDGSKVGAFDIVSGTKCKDIAARLTGEITLLERDDTILYVAGDDDEIKVVDLGKEGSLSVLKGHVGGVSGISCVGGLVAAVCRDSSLRIWEKTELKASLTLAQAPTGIHWFGRKLAVPGIQEVDVFEEVDGLWEVRSLFEGCHRGSLSLVQWSPNGKFMATSGEDLNVNIWDVVSGEKVSSRALEFEPTSIKWSPESNRLIIATRAGVVILWSNAIPKECGSPIAAVSPNITRRLVDFITEDSDNSHDQPSRILKKRKLLRDNAEDNTREVYSEDDVHFGLEDELDDYRSSPVQDFYSPRSEAYSQRAFQPGSTPISNGRRLLQWSLFGTVESQDMETHRVIAINFSDVGFHRPVRFNDHFEFEIATIGPRGVVLASKGSTEGPSSTVFFKPFNCWATNADWRLSLPEHEEAQCLALGNKWVAVATSMYYLRLFTLSGRQTNVISLAGPVVTMVGDDNYLAVVSHSAMSIPGNQSLQYDIYDISTKSKFLSGAVALSPGSTLTWCGYSDFGALVTTDSHGITRGLFNSFGWAWVALLDSSTHARSIGDTFWTVGVTSDSVMAALCKSGSHYPPTSPRPILFTLPWTVPLIATKAGEDKMASELVLSDTMLECQRNQLSVKEFNRREFGLDKTTLKLFKLSCEEQNQFRALDLCTSLRKDKSLAVALQIAEYHRLPVLSQKIELLQQNQKQKRQGSGSGDKSSFSVNVSHVGVQEGSSSPPTISPVKLLEETAGNIVDVVEPPVAKVKPSFLQNRKSAPKPGSFAAKLAQRRSGQSESGNEVLDQLAQ